MKKIDMHIHSRIYLSKEQERTAISRPGTEKQSYPTPEQIRLFYDELGIEKGILLPGESPEGRHYNVTNEEAMRIVKRYPDLFYWFCSIDPRWERNSAESDLSYYINHFKTLGAKGIGELTVKLPFEDPRMRNLFYHAQKCDMPILFHIGTQSSAYGVYDVKGLVQLEKTLADFPDLILIGHSQPFWAEIGKDPDEKERNGYPKGPVKGTGRVVELLRKYHNLHADLSANSGYNAITRDPEFGYAFLEEFQDRLYYGTDICVNDRSEFFKLSVFLDEGMENGKLNKNAYTKICRLNAINLLER